MKRFGNIAVGLTLVAAAVYLFGKPTYERNTTMSAGILELNDSNFAAEIQSGIVRVDFWAPWCGPCRMQTPILEQVVGKVEGAKIAKVNVDDAGSVAAKFGVQSIPTLIVFKDGKPVKQFVGVQQAPALIAALEAAK